MGHKKEEIEQALDFANKLEFIAKLDSSRNGSIEFCLSKQIPGSLSNEIQEMLNLCIEYYQRSIFMGEYQGADENPPKHQSNEPLEDINFCLAYYKTHFIKEVKKAIDVDPESVIRGDGPKLTPYAQAMLDFRKKSKRGEDR